VHTDKHSLGAIVKAARLKSGITQETLAERVGIGLRHIMGIENEGNSPSYEVLYKLIRELNISADSIFYPDKPKSSFQIDSLVRLISTCDERSLNIICATAQAVLDNQHAKIKK
jgi:transcriptional regulator with XRE-family HTH domain